MAKRLSDTARLASTPSDPGESHSISSRKIDNGYLVSQSSYNPGTGAYTCAERFVKNPPRLMPPKLDGRQGSAGNDGPEALSDAVAYMTDHGLGS